MSDSCETIDDHRFDAHNQDVAALWEAFHRREPPRVPVIFGISPRFWLLTPWLNKEHVTFREYTFDPEIMLTTLMRFQRWVRCNVPQDQEMGLPKDGWSVQVDFQNYYEAAFFGCSIVFPDGQVPDATPILEGDRKNLLFDIGKPDPLKGEWMERNLEYYERFQVQVEKRVFFGRPLKRANPAGLGTDGPLTIAYKLRGAGQLLLDMYDDPDYFHELMAYIVDATIDRIRALRRYIGQPEDSDVWGFADDAAEMLSLDAYKEFVLPHHRKLIETFGSKGPNSIHLCGDAQRLFPVIRDELNVDAFDTGFPIDFGALRRELGSDILIQGGPTITLLQNGSPEAIREEARRILSSGIMEGKRFILREANNLAPSTPVGNLQAMCDAARIFGKY